MLLYITILVSLVCCYVANKKLGVWLNHYSLYSFFSLGTIILYLANPLFTVKGSTIAYLLIGTLSYNLSILIFCGTSFKYNPKIKYIDFNKTRILIVLTIILVIPFLILFINQVRSGFELWYIRKALREEDLRSGAEKMIWLYYLAPVSMMLVMLSYYKYFRNIKKNDLKKKFFISLAIVIIFGLVDGGARNE